MARGRRTAGNADALARDPRLSRRELQRFFLGTSVSIAAGGQPKSAQSAKSAELDLSCRCFSIVPGSRRERSTVPADRTRRRALAAFEAARKLAPAAAGPRRAAQSARRRHRGTARVLHHHRGRRRGTVHRDTPGRHGGEGEASRASTSRRCSKRSARNSTPHRRCSTVEPAARFTAGEQIRVPNVVLAEPAAPAAARGQDAGRERGDGKGQGEGQSRRLEGRRRC